MAKQEYFWDIYKNKKLGDMEVQVKAIWDKNGKELYNGAKAKLDVPWGDGFEIGKIAIYSFATDDYDHEYSYGFKPKKGSTLYIEEDGSNIELI